MCEYARYPVNTCETETPVCEHTKQRCTLCVMGNAKTYKEAKKAEINNKKGERPMINRNEYCKDCERSIYATGDLERSCDSNVADDGYYNLAGEKCYCKIVNGERAEKYPWEGDKTDEQAD